MKFILAEDLFKDCITAKTSTKVKCIWAHNGKIFLTGDNNVSVFIIKKKLEASMTLENYVQRVLILYRPLLRLLNYPIIFQA